MKKQFVKAIVIAAAGVMAATAGISYAQEEKARSLDQLLDFVKQGQIAEARENKQREAQFLAAKNRQADMLNDAKRTRTQEEQRSVRLEKTFEENEVQVAAKQAQLKERLGALTELFGHITSAAGDARSNFETSLISVQYPNREEFLDKLIEKMNSSDRLPTISEIERLWFELQREMTESGKVVKFPSAVIKPSGEQVQTSVVRVGTFNVVSEEGKYLEYLSEKDSLAELVRQPSGPYTDWAEELAGASTGFTSFGIDPTGPTGGSYLAALIDSPTLEERWHQGGIIGYIITGVGVIAFIIAIWRLLVLTAVSGKVSAQLKSNKVSTNNPLGRVLAVHEQNPNMDAETLELKLNEAVLKEIPSLENSLTLLKIIAAVGPLLGLLGTVTGMIVTFQAITIYGAGDPKAMAGGISAALVTTVLGLCVAIPTILLHTIVSGRSKRIIHTLEEQAAGIIAEHTEGKLRKS